MIKQIPPLKRKKFHKDIDPDSLTAALYWDRIAKESLGDADIPLASGEKAKPPAPRKKRGL